MDCENLTKKQREIVDLAGNMDVSAFAVAGSGKTSVLVCTYMKILQSMDLPPDEGVSKILVITFTDDAATEIRGRIRQALMDKYNYIGPLNYISTIHSFANDILQHYSVRLGIDPGYSVGEDYLIAEIMNDAYMESKKILSQDEMDLLDEHIGILDQKSRERNLKFLIYTIYWKMKSTGWNLNETQEMLLRLKERLGDKNIGDKISSILVRIFTEFHENVEKKKKLRGILSYDDILYYAHQILQNDNEALESYRKKFEYVIVDEYQDTSAIQQEIIAKISKKGRRIIAGDYFQSIYEWRDAEPVLTMDFIKRNDFRTTLMDENFRSIPSIVDFVNSLFSSIFKKNIKDLEYIPIKAVESEIDGAGPFVITVKDDTIDIMRKDEAEKIAKIIKNLVNAWKIREKDGNIRNIRYGDISILFRKRAGMSIYANVLKKHGIKYSFIERGSFFESEEVSIIMKMLLSVRDGTWKDLNNGNTFEILKFVYNITLDEYFSRKSEKIEEFRRHMDILNGMKDGRKDRIILKFIRLTDYDLKVLKKNDGLQRYLNIYKLIDIAREKEENGIIPMDEFMEVMEKIKENEEISSIPLFDPMDDSVRLMTIHSSKGLEFPVVFVADLFSRLNYNTRDIIVDREAGIYLNLEELTDKNLMETIQNRIKERETRENMRVLYVAFTRAKQYLFIGLPDKKKSGDTFSSIIMETLDEDMIKKLREKCRIFLEQEPLENKIEDEKEYILLEPKSHKIDPIFLSVSDIKKYHFCPRYMEISKKKLFTQGEFGISFHEFMENVDFENPPQSDFDEILNNFLKTPLGDLIKSNKYEIKREIPFHIKYGKIIIRGRIDLLLISDHIIILDYKTGRRTDEDRLQMIIYSYAVKKIYGKIPNSCYLYYTGTNELEKFNFSDYDMHWLEQFLEEMVESIRKGNFGKNEKNCDICDLKEICLKMGKQN